MIKPITPQLILPCTSCSNTSVRKIGSNDQSSNIFDPIKRIEEEDKQLAPSSFSTQRQLTPEEEKRVLFLKNMLSQILALAGGEPTEEQQSRIKEIENELEKITGIKTNSRISKTMAKKPGKSNQEIEEEQKQKQMHGMDPKEAIHNNIPAITLEKGPEAMKILRQTGIAAYLKNMEIQPLKGLSALKI